MHPRTSSLGECDIATYSHEWARVYEFSESHVTHAIPYALTNKPYMSRETCLGVTNYVSSSVMYMSYVCVRTPRCIPPRVWQDTLQCVAVRCSVLQCVAVCCSVLHCVAVCCSVLQCVALCCTVLHCVAVCCSVLQCVAVCCSVLPCVAVCCSVLQMTII